MSFAEDPELGQLDRLLARKRWAEAEELLAERLRRRPDSVHLRQRRADVLELAGRADEARAELRSLAESLAADGFVAKAIAVFKRMERLGREAEEGAGEGRERLALLIRARAGGAGAPPGAARPPEGAAEVPRGVWLSPLFGAFGAEELVELIAGLELVSVEPGEIVVTEGEGGESMFVLASGAVRVYVATSDGGNRQIRRLVPGDFFGEISLLTGRPRTATIVAAEPSELLELDRATVLDIGQRQPEVRRVVRDFCLERTASRAELAAREVRI